MFLRAPVWAAAALVAIAACQSGPPQRAEPAASAHPKPSAPVAVKVDAQPLGGNAYQVTMTATPAVAVPSLELELDGRRQVVGPTAAGQPRAMTARVQLGVGRGREVAASASVMVGGHRRRAAAVVQVGTVPVVARERINIVRLPDGSEAAEVRQ